MESIIDNKDKLHFYEYLQADILQQYFRTGIHYFVNSILNAHPRLITLRYYSLEISTLIDFVKDWVSLVNSNGTYAENFYNLERGKGGKWAALKGAIIWTILPYLGTKLDNYYNEIVGEQIDGKHISGFKRLIKSIYPYLYAIIGILQAFYKFRYLYLQESKEHHYSLLYKLANVHLQYKESQQQSNYPLLELFKKPGLLTVLLGHKVLSWYFSQKRERKVVGKQKQSVQPPIADEKVEDSGCCSICTKKLKNPTIVRASGYVYCWECINDYVNRESRCPMSGLKVAPEDLQILYG